MMVEATQLSKFDNGSIGSPLGSSRFRSVFAQRQMCTPPVIIVRIHRDVLVQRSLTQNDYMIQTLAPDRTDQPFDVRPLPRRPWRRQDLLDTHRFHLIHELLAEDPVAITER